MTFDDLTLVLFDYDIDILLTQYDFEFAECKFQLNSVAFTGSCIIK